MKIKIDASELLESKWYEYALRFAFGGAITAMAGVIAKHYGPEIGGLFLAFPAILPATATLIEDDEKKKKRRAGVNGAIRGRAAAGVDAAGAVMGTMGLVVFALIVWQRLPSSSLAVVLSEATVAWLITSVSVWLAREILWRKLARKFHASRAGRDLAGNQSTSIDRRLDE
jgi:hypothetical protein